MFGAARGCRDPPRWPTNDQEIEDFVCDALDLLPGANDVDVRCDCGGAPLTGTVAHKRLKRRRRDRLDDSEFTGRTRHPLVGARAHSCDGGPERLMV